MKHAWVGTDFEWTPQTYLLDNLIAKQFEMIMKKRLRVFAKKTRPTVFYTFRVPQTHVGTI